MASHRTRIAALLVSAVAASALGWGTWRAIHARERGSLSMQVLPREAEPGLPRRPPEAAGFEVREDPADPREWRHFMNEGQARRFFPLGPDGRQVHDPWVFLRDVGNLDESLPWREHPGGKFRWRTNSLGCREDRELASPLPARRVLVAGDSHTCGVCENRESYANLLEAALAGAPGGEPTIEVLNAAFGGYTWINYQGTLLRFADFHPQVFVVGVYGGNDFHEQLPLAMRATGQPWKPLSAEQAGRRDEALKLSPDVMGQGFAAVDFFRTWPESQELALRASLDSCAEIQRLARARGAELVVVYLPSPFELAEYDGDARVARVREYLGVGPAELSTLKQLSDGLLSGLAALEVRTLDMRAAFAREPEPPFWKGDYHLNLRGHALVAQALEPVVRELLDAR